MSTQVQTVQDLMGLFGWIVDRHDLAGVLELFVEDATLEAPKTNTTVRGRKAIGELLSGAWERQPVNERKRRHLITGVRAVGIDGSDTRLEASFGVVGTTDDGQTKVYASGTYEGVARTTSRGLRFVLLRIAID
jgi:hypothetical protein